MIILSRPTEADQISHKDLIQFDVAEGIKNFIEKITYLTHRTTTHKKVYHEKMINIGKLGSYKEIFNLRTKSHKEKTKDDYQKRIGIILKVPTQIK